MCYIDYNSICTKCGKFQCDCGYKIGYINTRCNQCGEKSTLLEPCGCHKSHQGYGVETCPKCNILKMVGVTCNCEEVTIYKEQGVITTTSTTEAPISTDKDLEELYDELGTLKWIGGDSKDWDLAIDAVREHIRTRL